MAFPTILATATSRRPTAGASSTVNLPGGVQSGELLLVAIRVGGAGAVGWPSGWTEVFEDSSDASDDVSAFAWRRADGSEGTTISVNHGSAKSVALAWRITGASDPNVQAPQASSAAVGSNQNPDPPSLTPTGGAKDYLWIALAAFEGTAAFSSSPMDYFAAILEEDSGGLAPAASNVRISAGARLFNAASENPGTFSLTAGSLWSAWTIAVHPAGGVAASAASLTLDAPPANLILATQILATPPASFELDALDPELIGGPRIGADQAALAASAALAPILLVHLHTYSDVAAGTIQAEYYWSAGQDVLYPWMGGPVRAFEGAILRTSGITRKMEHLPNATLMDIRRTGLELVLANEALPTGGTRWSELRARNLLYARVELAVLLVPPERRLAGGPRATDLRDYQGIEHVFWFRGELLHVGPVTPTEIPLSFEAREPALDWPRCTKADECDPRHLGLAYSIPIGAAKSVPVLNRKVGWVTTLAEAIPDAAFTGARLVTDATGLPGGSFELQIGAERVTASKLSPTSISISARGQAATAATGHNISEPIIEIITSSTLVVAGAPIQSIDALYCISPLTGDRVLVGGYSSNLADTTLDSGRTLASVTFSAAQFRALIDAMQLIAEQASFIPGPGSSSGDSLAFQSFAVESSFPEASNVDAAAVGSPNRLIFVPLGGINEGGKSFWTSAGPFPNPTATVSRFRFNLLIQGIGGPGGFPASNPTRLMMKMTGLYGRTETVLAYVFDNGSTEFNVAVTLGWFNPVGGPHQEQQVVDGSGASRHVRFWIEDGGGGGFWDNTHNDAIVFIDSCELEVEVTTGGGGGSLTDLALAAASLGFGLDFVADVHGVQLQGVLAESAPDVIEWFIRIFAGLGVSAIDRASFLQASVDLGPNKLAGELGVLGDSFAGVLAGLCFNSRANLVAREERGGTGYRLLAAQAANTFPAASRTLSELRDQTETRREASEAVTRFLAHYHLGATGPDQALGAKDARELVRIDVGQNDATGKVATAALTAAEAKYGRRDGSPLVFGMIVDRATAIDVLGYYAFESIADRGRFAATISYAEGYDLELGDLVELLPQGYGVAVKARVIQLSLAPGEPHLGLVVEEVT